MHFTKVIQGSYYSAVSSNKVAFHENSLVCLNDEGQIEKIVQQDDSSYQTVLDQAKADNILWTLADDQYLLPGFIDTHVHAPQWPNISQALNSFEEDWFFNYTFPLEAKFSDAEFAHKVYDNLVQTLIDNGTTTVLYFGSLDNAGNVELVKSCQKFHQRGLIGKVVMDNPDECPDYYHDESTESALADTESFIQTVDKMNAGQFIKMQAVITPRYLTSCTLEGMRGLGQLAKKYDLLIQSHCSENNTEDAYALDNYNKRDSEMLDETGLLTDKAIMAHGTLLNDFDLNLFQERGTAISHCPVSNGFHGTAVLPVKKALEKDINVGLGTDICGGYEPSIYQTLRQAAMASAMLSDGVDNSIEADKRGVGDARITADTAFYLATAGGAKTLHLNTGVIEEGAFADLQVVHAKYPEFIEQTPYTRFEKLMYETTTNEIDVVLTQGIVAKGEIK